MCYATKSFRVSHHMCVPLFMGILFLFLFAWFVDPSVPFDAVPQQLERIHCAPSAQRGVRCQIIPMVSGEIYMPPKAVVVLSFMTARYIGVQVLQTDSHVKDGLSSPRQSSHSPVLGPTPFPC